jgi:hypothetical protein
MLVIGGAIVIAGASYLNTWVGLAAAVMVVAGLVYWVRSEPPTG